jgi:hypothetical protein
MHFPKYWARGEWTGTGPSGQAWNQVAWDCSDTSQEDAQGRATAKAQRLGERVGRDNARSADAYLLYANRPLREPVLRTLQEGGADCAAVITRTAYGSEVLNAEKLMFVDVDLPEPKRESGLMALLKRLFSGRPPEEAPVQSPVDTKLSILRQWQGGNAGWVFRVYRTHSGLRYLVTSALQDPVANLTHSVFATLGCDGRYQQLCKIQKSFRARLTPKPWRCGCPNPPVRFPYDDLGGAKMNQWITRYEDAAEGYATCQFLSEVGSSMPPAGIAGLVAEHDRRTRANNGLPLA